MRRSCARHFSRFFPNGEKAAFFLKIVESAGRQKMDLCMGPERPRGAPRPFFTGGVTTDREPLTDTVV
jgi:hypothetical protein